MASTLLHCSICPKRPNFSDTSHLLTHVGSKGHLAHLHKLQVRSHQEIAAGHQLATYNQWYQEHGLGQLLSERMQHKDSKPTFKRERGTPALPKMKRERAQKYSDAANFALAAPNLLPVDSGPRRRGLKRAPRVKRRSTPDEDSDYDSSPIKRNRRRRGRMLASSPIDSMTFDEELNSSDDDCPAEDDPQPLSTPNDAKLKGVIWPGMNLFDAATYEMRRRRNQRKDGSILKRMEKVSASIEPTEVVYSPGGTMRKQRYIDGMVDESSPLKGETPIPKPPMRRKRQALASISANLSRLPKQQGRGAKGEVLTTVYEPMPTFQERLQHVSTSSTGTSFEKASRLIPTEDENMEFQLMVGSLANRRRAGNFAVFNDQDTEYSTAMLTPFDNDESQNPLRATPRHLPPAPAKSQLSFLTTPWLQPQYQPLHYSQGYLARPAYPVTRPFQDIGQGQENVQWTTEDAGLEAYASNINPLSWQTHQDSTQDAHLPRVIAAPSLTKPTGFGTIFSAMDDPFAYPKNPLGAAFGQFEGHGQSDSDKIKRRGVSPDGTISDHEADYGQFAPSS